MNSFDLLRVLLALAVIYTHSYNLTNAPEELVFHWTRHQASASGIAVSGFFVISGFLITGSLLRSRSWKDYAVKRIRRIVPGFVVAVLFSFGIAGPLGSNNVHAYFHDPTAYRFLQLLVLKGPQAVTSAFPTNPAPGGLNGSLWTIRIELADYLLIAILGMAGVLRHKLFVLGSLIFAILLPTFFSFVSHVHLPLFIEGVLMYLPSFAAGAAFFIFQKWLPYSLAYASFSLCVLFATARLGGFNQVSSIFGTYIVLYLGLLKSKPWLQAARFGDFSYGLYLYAFPVQQLLLWAVRPTLTSLQLVFLTIPATLVLAVLSWYFIERPFLRRRRSNRELQTSAENEGKLCFAGHTQPPSPLCVPNQL